MKKLSNLKLDHVAINVKSIEESAAWYTEFLGAQTDYIDETWAMLDIDGTKLALTVSTQHPPHFAFCVEKLSDLGPDYREHRDGSCYVYKTDPDGNAIELIYWRRENADE